MIIKNGIKTFSKANSVHKHRAHKMCLALNHLLDQRIYGDECTLNIWRDSQLVYIEFWHKDNCIATLNVSKTMEHHEIAENLAEILSARNLVMHLLATTTDHTVKGFMDNVTRMRLADPRTYEKLTSIDPYNHVALNNTVRAILKYWNAAK
ncbi:hypothetical protein NCTGTJJY_CDS0003 [Serratia phage 92A1]|nr:hypothetical protein NCTGTJJY_CDS0003 [Serratia phage 92A1]